MEGGEQLAEVEMNRRLILLLLLQILIWSFKGGGQTRYVETETPAIENAFGSSLIKRRKTESKPTVEKRAQPANSDDDGDVVRVDTDLVVSDVSVFDKKGRVIKGLSRNDFRVEENGNRQEIEVFAFADDQSAIPRSIVLIIDYSESQLPYIKTSIEAAKVLVDMLHPNDKMAIVTDDVELLVNFTSDKDILKEKLESLKTRALAGNVGRSKQFSALMAVLNELFRDGDLRPKIIFQTDGDEYATLDQTGRTRNGETEVRFSYADILKAAEKAGTTIYSIIPGVGLSGESGQKRLDLARNDLENSRRSNSALMKINYIPLASGFNSKYVEQWADARERDAAAVSKVANATGGSSAYLEMPEQAAAVYSRILSEMNQRYVMGYYPTNTLRDGKLRKIRITTLSGKEHKILGRTSYVARIPEN
jgi:VWFA-related protein